MAELDTQSVYSLFVAGTHLFFSIMILRLYQMAKNMKLCRDSIWLKIGIILTVTGTMTLAAIPISELGRGIDRIGHDGADVMLWSVLRTSGLLILSFVMLVSFLKRSTWDGIERRGSGESDRVPLDHQAPAPHR